jgi:serine/threonine protein kinase
MMAGNADRTGQQLGNYQLTRLLARGGFAEVYLGQHIYLNNQAAIKVLLTQLTDDATERFINEARTLVNLIQLVIPIIVGLFYGFWAGLITGGLGYFLGNFISIAMRLNIASNSAITFLTLLIDFNGFWPRLYPYESVWLDFTHIALPNMLLVLILLTLLLTAYRLINQNKGQQSSRY